MTKALVIGGASFPCGVAALGDALLEHGYTPSFLAHPRNAASVDERLFQVHLEESLPRALALQDGVFLPLLESWVSEGRRLPDEGGLQFDKRAASISRSKLALSTAMADAGTPHVPRRPVQTLEEALLAASGYGYPIVLRSDTGYSGRGVWIAQHADELRTVWWARAREREGAKYVEMRSMLQSEEDVLIVEPWLGDQEWSLDCVVGPAGTHVIRVFEKATAIVGGRPATLGYRVVGSDDLTTEIRQAVERWCGTIFRAGVLSFACFDVLRDGSGDLVPLDFGHRLGGDGVPLLVRHASWPSNAYAAALDAVLAIDVSRLVVLRTGCALVHAYARQAGTLVAVATSGRGEVASSKPPGFFVEAAEGAPVHRRVGSVLEHFGDGREFLEACRNAEEWIRVDVR